MNSLTLMLSKLINKKNCFHNFQCFKNKLFLLSRIWKIHFFNLINNFNFFENQEFLFFNQKSHFFESFFNASTDEIFCFTFIFTDFIFHAFYYHAFINVRIFHFRNVIFLKVCSKSWFFIVTCLDALILEVIFIIKNFTNMQLENFS